MGCCEGKEKETIVVVKGNQGDPGEKGQDGVSVSITSTGKDSDGNTTVTFSDGTNIVISKGDKGDKGVDGVNGTSVTVTSAVTNADGNLDVTFSDGTKITIPKGIDGTNGKDGKDGVDGKSIRISTTATDGDGNTVITFSDGTVATVTKGKDGEKGQDGKERVQVSTDEPTNPDITLWIKPDGNNCGQVSKNDVDTMIAKSKEEIYDYNKVFADIKGVSGNTTANSFTTVPFNTFVTNQGGFELSEGILTIPKSGTYFIKGSVRLADDGNANAFGIGVHTSNEDGSWFSWQSSSDVKRKQYEYTRIVHLNKGEKLRMYVYDVDGSHPYYGGSWGTNMQVLLVIPDGEVVSNG